MKNGVTLHVVDIINHSLLEMASSKFIQQFASILFLYLL